MILQKSFEYNHLRLNNFSYNQCWKVVTINIFVEIVIWFFQYSLKNKKKEQHLFVIELFCNGGKVTFNQFNATVVNKSSNSSFKKSPYETYIFEFWIHFLYV